MIKGARFTIKNPKMYKNGLSPKPDSFGSFPDSRQSTLNNSDPLCFCTANFVKLITSLIFIGYIAMVALDQFIMFCKVYASDGVHFVKVEAEKFTFTWLRHSFLKKNKKVERVLAYDDLSGDRVLLSNEDDFKLMLDTMNDIGANMVKLYVEKKNKVTLADKCANCRGFIRGGSFGVFNAKNLAGFDEIGTTPNSEETFSKPLVNAFKAFFMLEKCNSLNVSGINVKLDGGSLNVVCVGKIGYSDVNLSIAERILTHLESEPRKCAWVATEGWDTYVLEFEGEEDAREFCVAVKGMMDRSSQSEGRLRNGHKL